MTGIVHFRLDGIADALDVAPATGESAIFQRGEVEVALELRVTKDGYASDDCLVLARVSREVGGDVYLEFERQLERLGAEAGSPPMQTGSSIPLSHSMIWLLEPPG